MKYITTYKGHEIYDSGWTTEGTAYIYGRPYKTIKTVYVIDPHYHASKGYGELCVRETSIKACKERINDMIAYTEAYDAME